MTRLPDFAEGTRRQRHTRRLALAWGASLTAIILALVVYAVVS